MYTLDRVYQTALWAFIFTR